MNTNDFNFDKTIVKFLLLLPLINGGGPPPPRLNGGLPSRRSLLSKPEKKFLLKTDVQLFNNITKHLNWWMPISVSFFYWKKLLFCHTNLILNLPGSENCYSPLSNHFSTLLQMSADFLAIISIFKRVFCICFNI